MEERREEKATPVELRQKLSHVVGGIHMTSRGL